MASTTKKTKTSVPAQQAPKPTLADEAKIAAGSFLARIDHAKKGHDAATAKFMEAAATDPLYACQWYLEKLAKARGEWRVWEEVHKMYGEDGTPIALLSKFTAIAEMATEQIIRLADFRPWDVNSTCQITNIMTRAKAVGTSRAWVDVRKHAAYLAKALKEANEGETKEI